jgi:uncharacterized membrane protein
LIAATTAGAIDTFERAAVSVRQALTLPADTLWLLMSAKDLIDSISRAVELAAAVVIAVAAAEATIKAALLFVNRRSPPSAKTEIRLTLGRWLGVGLEFELAADILRTAVAPTWNEIGQLAAIAAFRTALNYFLGEEIEKEASAERQSSERVISSASPRDAHQDLPGVRTG